MKAVWIGVAASFFFASSFVLNRLMEVDGGYWVWSGALRYFFMVPLLGMLVLLRKELRPVWQELRRQPLRWLLWSTVGFGLFYAPLCASAMYAPAWLTAAGFQLTIVAGMLLSPLFWFTSSGAHGDVRQRGRIPRSALGIALILLAGIGLMQLEQAQAGAGSWQGIILIIIAAIAYPLGNRKMMEVCDGRLNAFQRTLGMSIASLPFWLVLSLFGWVHSGLPSAGQVGQSLLVALFSGVIATVLFFGATDQARSHPARLAAVEATQALEVVFTLLGEWILLGIMLTSLGMWAGMVLVVSGVVVNAWLSMRQPGASGKRSKGKRAQTNIQ
ncbi:multidrug resistance efflux transporter family protein [Paenibacillus campi]|uniref:DMT family transporter n=1 Tax=Paenibacillus campi TaxID=3106031 RepID=UPI002AFF493B|nr:multidrug resistance efflux transporter family protein [Paenibacillus sp. SGZ-1014]